MAALRELLLEFTVKVDKAPLDAANLKIDALEGLLTETKVKADALTESMNRVGPAAANAANKARTAFDGLNATMSKGGGFGGAPGLAAALQAQSDGKLRNLFGSFGAVSGASSYAGSIGPMQAPSYASAIGPQRMPEYASAIGPARPGLLDRIGTVDRIKGTLKQGVIDAERFKVSGRGVLDTVTSLRFGLASLAGGAVVGGLARIVDHIGGIGEAASKLGVTTDDFQRLSVLAKQNAVDVGSVGTAFRTLARLAVDPTKDSAAAFAKLGVETKAADGTFKSRQDLFFETAGALADVGDETKRAQLATQLLGRSGTELLPILANGRAGLEAQRAALAKMTVLGPDLIKQADEFGDRWEIVKTGLLVKLAPVLERVIIPAMNLLVDGLVIVTDLLGDFVKHTNFTNVAITGLGVAFGVMQPKLLKFIKDGGGVVRTFTGMAKAGYDAAKAFALPAIAFLAFEDVLTFYQGGDSVTGRLMNAIFGEDEGKKIQQAARDILQAVKELFEYITGQGVGPALQKLSGELKEAAGFAAKDNFPFLRSVGDTLLPGLGTFGGKAAGLVADQLGRVDPTALGANGLPAYADFGTNLQGDTTDNRQQTVVVNVGTPGAIPYAVKGALAGMDRDRNSIAASAP